MEKRKKAVFVNVIKNYHKYNSKKSLNMILYFIFFFQVMN